MAYGFNLGQIEGLDSSVQTVTLTIANATESNTYTLTHNDIDDFWTDDLDTGSIWLIHIDDDVFALDIANFTESDVGDTYNVTLSTSAVEENLKSAVETVLVDNGLISAPETLFDGTITITAEDTRGVEIPFDKDVSAYPFEKWTVTINGLEISYQAGRHVFILEDGNIGYAVSDNDGVYMINVVNIQDASHLPVPGDYQVKIVGVSESGGEDEKEAILYVNLGDAVYDGLTQTVIDQITNAVENNVHVVGRRENGAGRNSFYTLTEAIYYNICDFMFVSMHGDTIKTVEFAGNINAVPLQAVEKSYTLTANS